MARATYISNKFYEVSFETVIRGHHVYKARWTPTMNEKLVGKEDERAEAIEYDEFAVGIFKPMEDNTLLLVGHAPIELSSLLFHFLKNNKDNVLLVYPSGKRYREVGLAVPGRYRALTKNKRTAAILKEQLVKKREFLLLTLSLKEEHEEMRLLPKSL